MENAGAEEIPEAVAVFVGLFTCFGAFIGLILAIVMVIAFCRIFLKAGYHWALGLLMLVPIANIIMPIFIAFSDWPVHRELRKLRLQQSNASGV